MFGNIYKLNTDNLYHYWPAHGEHTDCGLLITVNTFIEIRRIGQMGSEKFPNPEPEECCKICFKFLNK